MRKLIQWCGSAALVAGLGLAALPAQAEKMYSWMTEDGVYAYTDDAKKVPARYKDQVKRVNRKSLTNYERFTPNDSKATSRHAASVSDRLDKLRAMNAMAPQPTHSAAPQHASQFSFGIGEESPRLTFTGDAPDPVVIERLFTRPRGDTVSRRTTVVKQGDRTIAIVKGRRHHRNPVTDTIDESEL